MVPNETTAKFTAWCCESGLSSAGCFKVCLALPKLMGLKGLDARNVPGLKHKPRAEIVAAGTELAAAQPLSERG